MALDHEVLGSTPSRAANIIENKNSFVMRWEKGRQDSGYYKKLILRSFWPIRYDILLLRYPVGFHIDWHRDPVPGCDHYRLNVTLNWWFEGGEFESENDVLFSFGPFTFFRPDENEHRVTEIEEGTRYILSLGFAK